MAMAPVPTTTRLLTTVNARYYPVEGVADAYCLDGKFPGKRELRAVNSTHDREARGFLVSVFAYPSDARNRVSAWQEPLKKLAGQINLATGDIDTDINDLAEAALDVTGGLKLADESVREPYFAGIVFRDGELAAVTVGEGLAFIYRQEVLYPLTGHTKRLDPVDLFGDQVEGIEDFIAGEAGAIRYSNIAQIETGDVFVLCNGELFDVIGQKELMRLLSESEDQQDAAASLLTAAASQMPGTPIQVAVSKVEELRTSEQAPKFSLGRFATQAMEPVVVPEPQAPEPVAADPRLARTQRYERQDMVDRTRRKPPQDSGGPAWDLPPLPVSEATEPFETVVPHIDRGGRDDIFDEPPHPSAFTGRDGFRESDIFSEPPVGGSQEDDLPVFAYSQAAQRRKLDPAPYDDYGRRDDPWEGDDEMGGGRQAYDPYGDYDDYDDGYGRRPRKGSDRTRRIVFYAILITIILICIVALIKLLSGGKKPVETEPSISVPEFVEPEPTLPQITEEPEPTETEPTEPEGEDKIHVVAEGDTWWGICSRYYDRASETLCEKLAEYNNKSVSNLFVGNEIAIPPLSELLGE